MRDLLTVVFLIGAIVSIVSAAKYKKKILYLAGVILLIAFAGIALNGFAIGFAEGFIMPE